MALEGVEGSASQPGHSLPPGKTRYSLYRRLGGPQGRSGQMRKISLAPGFDLRTFQPVASRYTDYATRPTCRTVSLYSVVSTGLPGKRFSASEFDLHIIFLVTIWVQQTYSRRPFVSLICRLGLWISVTLFHILSDELTLFLGPYSHETSDNFPWFCSYFASIFISEFHLPKLLYSNFPRAVLLMSTSKVLQLINCSRLRASVVTRTC
jgi:hypothetical protein